MPTAQNVKRELERREDAANAARYKEKYQGWTNWATWNVALWLGNTENVYRDYRDRLAHHGPFTAKTAEAFVRSTCRTARRTSARPTTASGASWPTSTGNPSPTT